LGVKKIKRLHRDMPPFPSFSSLPPYSSGGGWMIIWRKKTASWFFCLFFFTALSRFFWIFNQLSHLRLGEKRRKRSTVFYAFDTSFFFLSSPTFFFPFLLSFSSGY